MSYGLTGINEHHGQVRALPTKRRQGLCRRPLRRRDKINIGREAVSEPPHAAYPAPRS